MFVTGFGFVHSCIVKSCGIVCGCGVVGNCGGVVGSCGVIGYCCVVVNGGVVSGCNDVL